MLLVTGISESVNKDRYQLHAGSLLEGLWVLKDFLTV